jgi:cysteine desulfurase
MEPAPIYLDHNATTPLRPEVVEAMARVLRDVWGNPSSAHALGAAARAELETARERVAALVGFRPEEIVFTASATEANNTALGSLLPGRDGGPGHLVTSSIEHPSVVEPAARLAAAGVKVTPVAVDAGGRLDPAAVAQAIGPETRLVSILWANNETGVIQDVDAIAGDARARGVPVHLDATQALGKIPVDGTTLPATMLSGSAHKLNGPKGAGFLAVREDAPLAPWIRGGPQERRRRGGTENVAGAVGLGVAAELARRELDERARCMRALRDRLWDGLRAAVPDVRCNAPLAHCLPNTLSVELPGAAGDVLVEALDLEGVCVSSGAACASGSIEPSHVLSALGRTPEQARATVRFSVGHGVDEGQIDRVLELLPGLVERVRQVAS